MGKRLISYIVVHCTASDNPDQDNPQSIIDLHTGPKDKQVDWGEYKDVNCFGWDHVGYHDFITNDGLLFELLDQDVPGYHVKGYNKHSYAICLSGNKEFTPFQIEKLVTRLQEKVIEFGLRPHDVLGHYELDNKGKTCPNIDMDIIRRRLV